MSALKASQALDELESRLGAASIRLSVEERLAHQSWYRIGGPARLLAAPANPSELERCLRECVALGVGWACLGVGSNLLISDQGVRDRLVIKTLRLSPTLEAEPNHILGPRVRASAGTLLASILKRGAREGWGGIEVWVGIPGSLGGAIWMNAGTHLGETCERIRLVRAWTVTERAGRFHLECRTYEGNDLVFEYRSQRFLPSHERFPPVIIDAEFDYAPTEPDVLSARIDALLSRRKQTQPIDLPSCGSVFKNPRQPPYEHAWQVIEAIGLRGHRIGGAQFSPKHANFIVNLGDARAVDVVALIELAQSRARTALGIELEPEVQRLGFERGAPAGAEVSDSSR